MDGDEGMEEMDEDDDEMLWISFFPLKILNSSKIEIAALLFLSFSSFGDTAGISEKEFHI